MRARLLPRTHLRDALQTDKTVLSSLSDSWVFWSPVAGIPHAEHPPAVQAWVKRIWARETVQKGMNLPAGREDLIKHIAEKGTDPNPPARGGV